MFRNIKEGVRVRQAQREADVVDLRRVPVEVEGQETKRVPASSSWGSQDGNMDSPRGIKILLIEHRLPE